RHRSSLPDNLSRRYALAVALTIERVALLRRVELFAGTPDRVLAGIARVLEEVTFPVGAVIMEAGAVEDWLFVLEHGEVEVIRPVGRPSRRAVAERVAGRPAHLLARRLAARLCALRRVRTRAGKRGGCGAHLAGRR